MRLALVHRAAGAAPAPAGSLTWRTCLRDVHFLDEAAPVPSDAFVDAEAYGLLLEIVCGLRSPLLGETEVQAQFKTFLAALAAAGHARLATLGQKILADAKHIRHHWLQGFGAHAYGRLIAPHLCGTLVVIVGTGAMARQVVAEAPREMAIDVWGRQWPDDEAWLRPRVCFRILDRTRLARPLSTASCTVVIAAPVGAVDISTVLEGYPNLSRIVDLRADVHRTPQTAPVPHVTLADLFAVAGPASHAAALRIDEARDEIARRSSSFLAQTQLRPFGWDDVCV